MKMISGIHWMPHITLVALIIPPAHSWLLHKHLTILRDANPELRAMVISKNSERRCKRLAAKMSVEGEGWEKVDAVSPPIDVHGTSMLKTQGC